MDLRTVVDLKKQPTATSSAAATGGFYRACLHCKETGAQLQSTAQSMEDDLIILLFTVETYLI